MLAAVFLHSQAVAAGLDELSGPCTVVTLDGSRIRGEIIRVTPTILELDPAGPRLFRTIPRDSIQLVIDRDNKVVREEPAEVQSGEEKRVEFVAMDLECINPERVDKYIIDETCELAPSRKVQVWMEFEVKRVNASRKMEVRNMNGRIVDPISGARAELDCGVFAAKGVFEAESQMFLEVRDITLGRTSMELILRITRWDACMEDNFIGHLKTQVRSLDSTFHLVGELFYQ